MMAPASPSIHDVKNNMLLFTNVSFVQNKKGVVVLYAPTGKTARAFASQITCCSEADVKPGRLTNKHHGQRWVRVCAFDQECDKIVRMNLCLHDIAQLFCVKIQAILDAGRAKKLDEFLWTTARTLTSTLSKIDIEQCEFNAIAEFYQSNKKMFEMYKDAQHIRSSFATPTPFSMVYVPRKPLKGLHILLKSHRGVPVIGEGDFNRVTRTLHLDTGRIEAFRSGKWCEYSGNEIKINRRIMRQPEHLKHFSAGIPVIYKRIHIGRKVDSADQATPNALEEIYKAGYICEFHERGNLYEHIKAFSSPSTSKEMIEVLGVFKEIAVALLVLHEQYLWVHLDVKPENVYFANDGHIRVGDFGLSRPIGQVAGCPGTPGYLAPEMVRAAMNHGVYHAHPKADVWSFACLMADMISDEAFFKWNEQSKKNFNKMLDNEALDEAKKMIFPQWNDRYHLHHLIFRCLVLEPEIRPTMGDVAETLRQMEMFHRLHVTFADRP